MAFAASISEHPVPATAVGEIAGYLIEHIGVDADLMCVFVTPHHAGALEDISAALRTLLRPKVLIGCAAQGVIGPGREVENGPAISVWAGHVGNVQALRLDVVDHPNGGKAISGWSADPDLGPTSSTAILITDPYTFPVDVLLEAINDSGGFPRVVGGMASGGTGIGGNRLLLNDQVFDSGAIGVLIEADESTPAATSVGSTSVELVVSQGCRPIGSPYVVTRSDRNVIYELAGEPGLTRLTDTVRNQISEEEAISAREGLLVGIVIDEHMLEFEPGDFLVRTFIDADPREGSLTIGERIEVGTTVQFHLRDADTADAEIRNLLRDRTAEGVLLFSCNGRGEALFGEANHDAEVVADLLDRPATAGFFAAGELGPVGGKNFIHGFTASMALFDPAH